METVEIVKALRINPSDRFVAFVGTHRDSCTEKILDEYAPYFMKVGYNILFTPDDKADEIMNYAPRYLVMFRSGLKVEPVDAGKLVTLIDKFQHYGVRVVYYVDDFSVLTRNNGLPLFLASKCDSIITSTSSLKEYIVQSQVSKPVVVVPTHIDIPTIDGLEPVPGIRSINKFKVLLSSSGRLGSMYLRNIAEMIEDDLGQYKDVLLIVNAQGVVQMRTIINEFRHVNKIYFDWLPLKDFYRLAKSVDIMIAPACEEDLEYLVPPEQRRVHLDSKSPVKYTIAGAVSIPCIASPIKEYSDAICHGENGLIAQDPREFLMYINMLRDNKELRENIGRAARKDVEENFHIASRFNELFAAITGDMKYSIQKTDANYVYIPPLAGGPRTFYTTLERYIEAESDSKWKVTDNAFSSVKAGVIIAFYGLNECKAIKNLNPDFKIITRVDGLPMNFDGSLNKDQLKLMIESMEISDQIIWQSEHCKNIWKEFADTSKGVTIHNGVDVKYFKELGDKFADINSPKIRLLNVNFSTFKHKRIDILRELISKTPEGYHWYTMGQYLDTSVVNDMEMFKAYPNVTFFGPVANYSYEGRAFLASVYRSCDALVFTSEMEGSPNTIMESCACGLPVIYNASNSVIPEILGEFCIPVNDSEGFNEQLKTLEDGAYVTWLKDGMRERMKNFTAEICASKYLEVFKEVCQS
jgi:glycosyltransferase involved in cell wall biosynthesis